MPGESREAGNLNSQEYIINANLIDSERQIVSAPWFAFKSPYAILGFLQYVFLPTLSYYLLEKKSELQMPLVNTETLCEYLEISALPEKKNLLALFIEVQELWQYDENIVNEKIVVICEKVNALTFQKNILVKIFLFDDATKVCDHIKEHIWSEEVFKEDFGCSYCWLEDLCLASRKGPFFKNRLLKFLNSKVGCLVG